MSKQITEADLNAYVDGQLDPSRISEVESFLAKNPDIAKQIQSFAAINQNLHCLYDDVLQEPVPDRLHLPNPRYLSAFKNAAMILLSLGLGSAIGWMAHDKQVNTTQHFAMMDDAFTSHVVYTPEVRHPVEVGSEQYKHLFAWLSKRLNTDVRAPSLSKVGYELLGGRLLGSEGKPAAQFMYQNQLGQRLTLFLRQRKHNENETAFRFAHHGDIHGFYWIDGNLAFALIGDISKEQLSNAAHIIYTALN